jgi:hypothetical protein
MSDAGSPADVRFAPRSDRKADAASCRLGARSDHSQSKEHPHSITSSAAQQRQNAKYHAVQIVKLSAMRHD